MNPPNTPKPNQYFGKMCHIKPLDKPGRIVGLQQVQGAVFPLDLILSVRYVVGNPGEPGCRAEIANFFPPEIVLPN